VALTAETRLGPYEIVAAVGAGGMGEVYRAHDPRLGRDVAIKVVLNGVAESQGSRERFEREAKAVAALSHPNIVAIHDVGTADGQIYAVMELLDGETLRTRLERGPLSWRKAIQVASAVGDGLGAAHARGMVHRDLKPANIFLTSAGLAKVLDFGLATLPDPAAVDPRDSLTVSQTNPDAALGTLGYMSPEHVAGITTDARSDLFALGCVLYEMVSGARAFARKTPAETMAAILNDDPPEIAVVVPFELRRLIAHCLEKDPDARFQSARDLAFHLGALLEPASSVGGTEASRVRRTRQRRVVWLAGGAAALAAVAALGLLLRGERQPAPAHAIQSYLLLPDGTVLAWAQIEPSAAAPIALSPDGRQVVLAVNQPGGRPWLWVRSLDSQAARRLEGTEDAAGPFWSPDSRFIGFNSDGRLKTIAVSGGPPQTLGDTRVPNALFPGGAWSPAGDILFGQYALPILRFQPSGGPPVPATEMDRSRGDTRHCCPAFLPDGHHFLYFVSGTSPEKTGIYVGSVDSKVSTFLVRSTGNASFAPPDHLLFRRGSVLMVVSFDAKLLRLTGEPTPLADHGGAFSASSTGVLVYAPAAGSSRLAWLDRKGNEIEELPITGVFRYRRLSHDGGRLAASVPDPQTGLFDLWVYDLVRHFGNRLTFHSADEIGPVWSPDDERIVFSSNRTGRFDIYQRPSDGTGDEELLYQSAASKGVGSWSEDRRYLVFNTDGEAEGELWSLLLPERKPARLLRTSSLLWDGQISPDGRFIAYMSGEAAGRLEVYVQSFPSGPKWRLSTSGGLFPRWGPDGKELFFVEDGTRTLMAVDLTSAGGFGRARPRALFSLPASYLDKWYNTADGRRFLFAKPVTREGTYMLTLVQNWPALLTQ
jgi:Tol biopolymer transport system component